VGVLFFGFLPRFLGILAGAAVGVVGCARTPVAACVDAEGAEDAGDAGDVGDAAAAWDEGDADCSRCGKCKRSFFAGLPRLLGYTGSEYV
jgi:hypothetical protein